MLPESHRIDAAFAGHHVEHTARHRDIADPLKSEGDYRAAQRLHFLKASEDVDIDHVGGRIKRKIPHMLDDHGAGDPPAGIPHKIFEQGKFLCGQLDTAPGAFDTMFHAIQFEVIDHEYGF